jgi:hypothetical protein
LDTEQAELLRKGQFNSLDIPNLIEEIETMGEAKLNTILANA